MLTIICISFLAFLFLYEPIWGYKMYQRFQLLMATEPGARLLFYKSAITGLWLLTALLAIVLVTDLVSPEQVGLIVPSAGTNGMDETTSFIIITLAVVYFGLLVYQWLMLAYNKPFRQKMQKEEMPASVSILLPVTEKEKKVWFFVSFTAGVTEEFIYRGFLLFTLSYLFSNVPLWMTVPSAALLFGLGHRYQGWSGIIKTAMAGLFFCMLYLATGSILPGMLLHFLQDYIARYLAPEESQSSPNC